MTNFNESQKAAVYATLILHDDNLPVTSENILKITKAAGIQIEKIWAEMFERTFKGKDIGEFILSVNSGAQGSSTVKEEKVQGNGNDNKEMKEEKEKSADPSSDEEMGLDLFG